MNVERKELEKLIGDTKADVFYNLVSEISSLYDMEQIWNSGGKKWVYEYKFRKGSKTLCAFYFRENTLGLMIIFGRDERTKVGEIRDDLSLTALAAYNSAETYHDGKWVMFDIVDFSLVEDLKKLLLVKRKPNQYN